MSLDVKSVVSGYKARLIVVGDTDNVWVVCPCPSPVHKQIQIVLHMRPSTKTALLYIGLETQWLYLKHLILFILLMRQPEKKYAVEVFIL